jgi:OOP family OmpA-OmpF porin
MNTKNVFWLPVVLVLVILAGGCAMHKATRQPPAFQVQPLVMEMWRQKTDNLVFILDASASMTETYNEMEKFAIGRSVVANFNQTIPDVPLKVALRSFGHSLRYSFDGTVPAYALADYSRDGVAGALAQIVPAGGPSPMEKSFAAAAEDLQAAKGTIAMVVVSDGKDMNKTVLKSAQALGKKYGERLCIYTVLVGDDEAGRTLLSQISQVTGCGEAITAADVETGAAMADFVATVLLEKSGSWVFHNINFKVDKADLLPRSYRILNRVVQVLNNKPGISVEIQGHTDSTASNAYNMDLSQRRAQTVMKYLESKGIAASRMTAVGYGEEKPIATNDTAKGKAKNRRVEFKLMK